MRITILLISSALAIGADTEIQQLMSNGHFKRARALAEAAYQKNPNDAFNAWALSRVRHEFGNVDESVKLAEIAVKLDPKSSRYHRELGEACADAAGKVSFLKQIGYGRRIHNEFDAALAIDPKDPNNIFDQVQFFMEAPGVMGGDKKKAVEIAADLVKIDAARGYLAQAYIARKEKQNDKLEGLYQKAFAADPKNLEARVNLLVIALNAQPPKTSVAEEHARAVLDQNPDRVEGYRWLAYTLAFEERYDEAAKILSRGEAAIPDDISPYVAAARAILRNGEALPKAEEYLKKYINQTKEPEVNSPRLESVHWSLASAYEKQGKKAEAIAELETALRIKPDFEPAKKDLKRLK